MKCFFRQANIRDAVGWLNGCIAASGITNVEQFLDQQIDRRTQLAEKLNQEIEQIRKRRAESAVNKELAWNPAVRTIVLRLEAPASAIDVVPEDQEIPRMTFTAHDITLNEALRLVAEATRLKCETKGDTVILRPFRKGEKPVPAKTDGPAAPDPVPETGSEPDTFAPSKATP